MTLSLLSKIADMINSNSTRYQALVPMVRKLYMQQVGTTLVRQYCLVLQIMVVGKSRNHIQKNQWKVFEYDMDRTITKLARKDMAFAERLSREEPSLHDVELIIRRASYQSLKPRLAPVGIDTLSENL